LKRCKGSVGLRIAPRSAAALRGPGNQAIWPLLLTPDDPTKERLPMSYQDRLRRPGFASALLRCAAALALPLAACATAAAAPRAEIQINLCSEPQDIVRALALRPEGAAPREAWYFDTPDLALFGRGLVFRLRLTDPKPELTLKVADQDCTRVDPALVPKKEGKCEYDLHGASLKGAVSLNRGLDEPAVRGLLDGKIQLADALSNAQIRYLREGVSAWPLTPGVKRLGPVQVRTYEPADRRFVVEMWSLPDGARYIEMSKKVEAGAAQRGRAELEAVLARAGLAICPDQSSQAGNKLRALAR
jgi:hypothetical protein